MSGSHDKSICLWDVGRPGAAVDLQPSLFIQEAHKGAVEDVDWHRSYDFLFGSVGDDRAVHLWDCRTEPKSASNTIVDAHAGDAHCLSFNHYSEFLLATGGADKCVCLWDLRKLKERVHKFEGHEGEVMSVAWSPFGALTLASGGSDRKVVVWDVDKIGKEQSAEDAEDGPPELFFSHGGHTARVSELSWNTNEEYVFASVDEDNSLQVWQMVRRVYACACAWARSFACACLCAGEGEGRGGGLLSFSFFCLPLPLPLPVVSCVLPATPGSHPSLFLSLSLSLLSLSFPNIPLPPHPAPPRSRSPIRS